MNDIRPLLATHGYLGVVGDDIWAGLADHFVDEAYASVKGPRADRALITGYPERRSFSNQ